MKTTLQTRSVVDALRAALQESILRGEIVAGSALTEKAIAEQYTVARPTAKAALEKLEQGGLLRRSANQSARVPLLDAEDVRDLYFSRAIVERGVVSALAARREAPTVAAREVTQLLEAVTVQDVPEIVRADVAFHRALVVSLHSPRVTRLHDAVIGETHLCMAQVQLHHLLDPQVIANEHTAILDAIAKGDQALSERELDSHLNRARDRLVGHLDQRDMNGA